MSVWRIGSRMMSTAGAILAGLTMWAVPASAQVCDPHLPLCTQIFIGGTGLLSPVNVSSNVPIDGSATGVALEGNFFGSATVGAGILRERAQTFFTVPSDGNTIGGNVQGHFSDIFAFTPPGAFGPGFLRFTLALTGTLSTVGSAEEARVNATMSLEDLLTGVTRGSFQLTGPGVVTGELPIEIGVTGGQQFIEVIGEMGLDVAASGPGSAIADFSNTFEITNVQLLDANGNVLRDVILTDSSGNSIGGATIAATPEPGSLVLLGVGIAMLAIRNRTRLGRTPTARLR